jgi:preprotein translocase subunit SecG
MFMDISSLIQKLQTFIPAVDLGMELKTFTLLVAILFFLISLLFNLLQRRYSKARFYGMLTQEEGVIDFLEGINKNLEDLEFKCSIELHGATSPQEVGKVISAARNKIQSTLAETRNHLCSFRQYRKKEKAQKKLKKQIGKHR